MALHASAGEEWAVSRLSVVQSVTEVGLLPLDPDATLRELLRRVRTGLRADAATMMLVDRAPHLLVARASVGLEAEVAAGVAIPLGRGITGRVAALDEPVVVPDLLLADPYSPFLAEADLRSMAAVPLTVAGSVIGVLHVTSRTVQAFDADDLSLLRLVADRVALAVERVGDAERQLAVTQALRASEQRARAVLRTAVDGIIMIDGSGLVESLNPAAERMFGYAAQDVVGRNVSMLMPEPYRSGHDGYLARYRATGERRVIGSRREVVGRRSDGNTFPMELSVSQVGPDGDLFTGVVRDVSQRTALEAQLAHHALHDPLTGLANRRLLTERIEHSISRLARHPGMFALLFLDLDGFKLVNDTFGHAAGDELLVHTALMLREAVRPEDLVARVGGDEFVILCADVPGWAGVEALARRVTGGMTTPVTLGGREVHPSASVGVVAVTTADRAAKDLLRDADAAMYQAKQLGPGRYALLDDAGRAVISNRLEMVGELRHALERCELRASYQPLVDLGTGAVTGSEALLRWQHSRHGLLLPAAFLSVAEDVGAIVDFDAWMLRTACQDTADWGRRTGRPMEVWVNLSGRSLASAALADAVTQALEQSGLAPDLLTLEITEGALMRDAAATVGTLTALRGLGVQLAVDDFGTGYSSLAYLQQFPVHALKVDRSFVDRLDSGESSAMIVKAVVALADGLDLRTVAEGIETPGQLAAVTALDCDLGQGFFLGRPASREKLSALPEEILLPPSYEHA